MAHNRKSYDMTKVAKIINIDDKNNKKIKVYDESGKITNYWWLKVSYF